ncbi:MAG: M48 family metallopeptidase [Janthinobacterium lividum]
MPDRQRFPGLSSTAFEHPTDKATLAALRKAPGIDWVFRKFNEYGGDRTGRLYCLSDTVRVDRNQCRNLYAMLLDSCAILDMPVPQLFIDQRPFANAFTFCVESPIIVLYSGLIDLLDEDEWRVVLGHELGHIKAGHVLYRQIAEFLASLLMRLGGRTFGLAQGLGAGLFYAFFHWYRQSELTADRAGLLASQDITTVLNVQMKLAGGSRKLYTQMDKDAFLQQGRDYEEMGRDALNSFLKMGQTLHTTHPFPAVRALETDAWFKSGEYEAILSGNYSKSSEPPMPNTEVFQDTPPDSLRKCPNCKAAVSYSAFVFCPNCGADLPR